jgi:hypothetical protein
VFEQLPKELLVALDGMMIRHYRENSKKRIYWNKKQNSYRHSCYLTALLIAISFYLLSNGVTLLTVGFSFFTALLLRYKIIAGPMTSLTEDTADDEACNYFRSYNQLYGKQYAKISLSQRKYWLKEHNIEEQTEISFPMPTSIWSEVTTFFAEKLEQCRLTFANLVRSLVNRAPVVSHNLSEEIIADLATDLKSLGHKRALTLYEQLQTRMESVALVFHHCFSEDELTYRRSHALAHSIYSSAMERLRKVALVARTINDIDPEAIEKEICTLQANDRTPTQDLLRISLLDRKELHTSQTEVVETLLAEVMQDIVRLERASERLSKFKPREALTHGDSTTATRALDGLLDAHSVPQSSPR